MFNSEDSTQHVGSRLKDYFGRRTPWQRRLWNVGTALALMETIEAAEHFRNGHLNAGSFKDLTGSLKAKLGKDPGTGGGDVRRHMQLILDSIGSNDRALAELRYLVEPVHRKYMERWRRAVEGEHSYGPEYVSRTLGSHLLDAGFSQEQLHRWISSLEHDARILSLTDLFDEADALVARPVAMYEVLVPVAAIPKRSAMPLEWHDAAEVNSWLRTRAGDPSDVRQNGGFIFRIDERDSWAAVERARDRITSMTARIAVGLPGMPVFAVHNQAWVAGKDVAYSFSSPGRQVDVHSLDRQQALFSHGHPGLEDPMASALELLASLETGTPGTAVASGWAAIEILLSRPDSANATAADELALLVACSFPRAELTTLSYRYADSHDDEVSEELRAATSNRHRAATMANAITAGIVQPLPNLSDNAAIQRMRDVLTKPNETLGRIRGYASEAFRRLYRQRNLVLHSGDRESVALRPVLRTVPPLVGAGIDRIVHAALDSPPQRAVDLVARASTEIALVGTSEGTHIVDLLDA